MTSEASECLYANGADLSARAHGVVGPALLIAMTSTHTRALLVAVNDKAATAACQSLVQGACQVLVMRIVVLASIALRSSGLGGCRRGWPQHVFV